MGETRRPDTKPDRKPASRPDSISTERKDPRSFLKLGLWLAVIGAIGWTFILRPDLLGVRGTVPGDVESFLIFAALGVVATQLGVNIFGSVAITLDTAFFSAAIFCIGPVWASRAIAIATVWQGIWAWVEREKLGRRGGGTLPVAINLLRIVYTPALSAGLVIVLGAAFGVESSAALQGQSLGSVAWMVPALGACFIVLHYSAQTFGFGLQGYNTADLFRRVMAPGMLTEMGLLPIAVVLVLVFPSEQEHMWTFALVSSTYLLINLTFRRVTVARDRLAARVGELETLSVVAREVTGTLNVGELVPRLRASTMKLVEPAKRFLLGQFEPAEGGIVVEVFDRDGRLIRKEKLTPGVGPEGVVVATKLPLRLPDVAGAPPPIATRGRSGAYLGFPLLAFEEVIGVLAVEADRKGVFTEDHHRIGNALAAQAAVAIQNANLYELATVDGLTGLYVRRYFDQRLSEEVERGRRHGAAFSVILLDLDDFSQVNNRFGHAAGDTVLKQIAGILRRDLRALDIPARYGGEEFAVILPGTPVDEALIVAKRICFHCRGNAVRLDDRDLVVTASVGVAGWQKDDTMDDVVARADEMMYVGKRAGKDQVVVARATGPELHPARESVV